MYGVDVAATRADDLDKKLLALVASGEVCSVLDIGCGTGGQAARLAAKGAEVLAIDIVDYSKDFDGVEGATFKQADMRSVFKVIEGRVFDAVLVQRTIHYLRYEEALSFLQSLRLVTDTLFISATGLASDIGEQYEAAGKPVEDRFACLQPSAQKIFSISEPVCLYSETEFIYLLQESGWEIEEFWLSAFGNIKAICASVEGN